MKLAGPTARRPRTAGGSKRWQPTASDGNRWPAMASDGKRQQATASDGQRRPAAPDFISTALCGCENPPAVTLPAKHPPAKTLSV